MNTTIQKTVRVFLLFSFFFSLSPAFAQAPQKMSYQAVIRNASNALVTNSNVGMRISVLQGTASGTAVYVETQTATTNANGLATLEIGAGTVVSGTFASISWGTNTYFIKTETDPTGGTNYTIVGTSQFLSVPYALFASNSGSTNNWTTTGNNIANNNTGNVGIGTGATVPSSLLTVKAGGIGFTQEDSSGANQIGFYTNENYAWIQTHTNTDLSFTTDNGSTQMVLQKETGNLGIGVDDPDEKLVVDGKTKTYDLQVVDGAGEGKVLTSDAAGNATWQTASGTGLTHYIGEIFGGGIVVAVWKTAGVEHGLIVSPTNLHNPANGGDGIPYSNVSTTLIGPTAASISDGQANTTAIISQPGHTVSAASVCRAYNGGGFNDWYLPAVTELNECRNNLFVINKVAGSADAFYALTYWSSTESFNGSYAMSQNFNLSDSVNQTSFKTDPYGIRAMRRF
jgi:hypothetical protein